MGIQLCRSVGRIFCVPNDHNTVVVGFDEYYKSRQDKLLVQGTCTFGVFYAYDGDNNRWGLMFAVYIGYHH